MIETGATVIGHHLWMTDGGGSGEVEIFIHRTIDSIAGALGLVPFPTGLGTHEKTKNTTDSGIRILKTTDIEANVVSAEVEAEKGDEKEIEAGDRAVEDEKKNPHHGEEADDLAIIVTMRRASNTENHQENVEVWKITVKAMSPRRRNIRLLSLKDTRRRR